MDLTIGLVGCGRWGINHLRTLMSLKSIGRLGRVVVCDIDPTKLDALEADATYPSLTQMLEDEQLNGLAIVTPPDTHVALARQGLAHNLPLLVEKPLALDHESAVDFLTSLPNESVLVVGYILRHHHGIKRLLATDVQGALGDLLSVRYDRQTVRARPPDARPISTLGVHALDLIAWLMGQTLTSGEVVTKRETDDDAAVRLVFPSGQEGVFDVAWSAPEERRFLHLEGALGRAILDFGSGLISLETGQGTKTIQSAGHEALVEEWHHFLDHITTTTQHVFPSVERLLDQSEWLKAHSAKDSV